MRAKSTRLLACALCLLGMSLMLCGVSSPLLGDEVYDCGDPNAHCHSDVSGCNYIGSPECNEVYIPEYNEGFICVCYWNGFACSCSAEVP